MLSTGASTPPTVHSVLRALPLIPGVLTVAVGALVLYASTVAPGVEALLLAVGLLLVVLGLLLLRKGWEAYQLAGGRRGGGGGGGIELVRAARAWSLLAPLLLHAAAAVAAYAQATPQEVMTQLCYQAKIKLVYVEYAVLGLVVALAFFALLPFAGPEELRMLMGPLTRFLTNLLFVLIFVLLLIYPLDVMFDTSGGTCVINVDKLRTEGPPLLRILLWIMQLPQPPSISTAPTRTTTYSGGW